MDLRIARSMSAFAVVLCFGAGLSTPAEAQSQPQPPPPSRVAPSPVDDLATGERYHVEAAVGYWFPGSNLTVSSAGSGALAGLIGSTIDFKRDLGLTDTHFPEMHLEARPVRSQKIRFQYIPISFQQSSLLQRDLLFNGQRYRLGLPVESTLEWKAYRFGWEADLLT